MEVIYALDFSQTAMKDIEYFKRLGDRSIIRKIDSLLKDLEQHPFTGIGRPEVLRFELSGFMSRRINGEHRLIYHINEDDLSVHVVSLKGHYEK